MITQSSKNATNHAVFWYNEHYLKVIVKTYFLIRFLRYMKYGTKNLRRDDGICIKADRKRTGCPIKNFGHDIYLVSRRIQVNYFEKTFNVSF
ncbi:MAG: hypothetical protein HY752_00515 [Nitrospirae bacterium]|nr:hypothetical protein [Nitrospirota bacterium]